MGLLQDGRGLDLSAAWTFHPNLFGCGDILGGGDRRPPVCDLRDKSASRACAFFAAPHGREWHFADIGAEVIDVAFWTPKQT
jgi:hypothetical protein